MIVGYSSKSKIAAVLKLHNLLNCLPAKASPTCLLPTAFCLLIYLNHQMPLLPSHQPPLFYHFLRSKY